MDAAEGAKFIKEVSSGLDEKRQEAENFVKNTVNKAINELGLVKRDEYEDLKSKYEELKSKMDNNNN